MVYRRENSVAVESSKRIYEAYLRLLELENNLKKRNVPKVALSDLEDGLDREICELQYGEIVYTSLNDGKRSPYYEFLLKTADRVLGLIHFQLNKDFRV
ncbi:MAG: hypothetical protein WC494_00880 [Candidatus Pacearchaeota archaeon]